MLRRCGGEFIHMSNRRVRSMRPWAMFSAAAPLMPLSETRAAKSLPQPVVCSIRPALAI